MDHTPKQFRRALRREATPAERRLWAILRDRQIGGLKFRRQHTVGAFTLDFYCHEARLAVEVNGTVHEDPARAQYDGTRERSLAKRGIRIIRFANRTVLEQPDIVADAITSACLERL